MNHSLPTRFFDHPTNLLVIHQDDSDQIHCARMAIECLAALALGEGKIDAQPIDLQPEQLACMLSLIADKLDIPDVSYVNVVNARHLSPTQGA